MSADRELDPRREAFVVGALLAALGLALLLLAATTPWTADEGTYLDAGRMLAHRLDWEPYITYAHGPLPFYANQLLAWAVPTDPPQGYLFAGRVGMLGFALFAAWSTNRLARAAFGPTAGLFALGLFALNPILLGHGCLMATAGGSEP